MGKLGDQIILSHFHELTYRHAKLKNNIYIYIYIYIYRERERERERERKKEGNTD